MINIINADCNSVIEELKHTHTQLIMVTDPPFNIGYKYRSYRDKMNENEYFSMLCRLTESIPFVLIHYPEQLHKLSIALGESPTKVCSWVYNSNTGKQHRDIAFYRIKPNMNQVKQPYKNQTDKRIKALMENGSKGSRLYDWWNINQVKNVSKEKLNHPCQMPIDVMTNVIGVLPKNATIIDPFMGTGTTGMACKLLGLDFIGIELDEVYFRIAKERLQGCD